MSVLGVWTVVLLDYLEDAFLIAWGEVGMIAD